MPRHLSPLLLACLALSVHLTLLGAEQTESLPVAEKELSTEAALEAKQETISSQVREAIEEQHRGGVEDATSMAGTELSEVELLKLTEVTVAQQRSATSSLKELQSKVIELKTQLDKLDSGELDEKSPYSILLLDQLNDSIANSTIKRASIEESILAARENVERTRLQVDSLQKSLRQLKQSTPTSGTAITKTQLEVRLAEETLVLRKQELDIEQSNEQIRSLHAKIDERKHGLVVHNVVFDAKTIEEKNTELDARESELKKRAEQLQLRIQEAERRWMSARQDIDATNDPTPQQVWRTEALKIALNTIQVEQSVNHQRIQRLPMMRTSWDRRYQVATKKSSRLQQKEWLSDTVAQMQQLARERRLRELKLNEMRTALATVSAKKDEADLDQPEVNRWIDHATDSLSAQIELHNRAIVGIDSGLRALSRLRVEIEGQPARSLDQWLSDSWLSVVRIWNYELSNIQDTSLTVGRVVSCLMFSIIGYYVARFLSRLLGRRLPKVGIDEAAAHAIESITFYILMILFGLGTLRFANVPLTAFTFLGGAIAIGVGFGSQNIVNNFISGLILLAERPIKAGDLIQIDGNIGNVTQIGARSTKIRTGENLDIIVPNSKFLENNVVNLTYSDDLLRASVKVGVAYGSPLDQVMTLLAQAAQENPNIEASPEPLVWFNEFGENSLDFQVNFWIRVRTAHPRKSIETEVRLAIDRLFREHDIAIPYPQRELHLKASEPLAFRMIQEETPKGLKAAS
jgi:potassium-dependent mechanosensitive channel